MVFTYIEQKQRLIANPVDTTVEKEHFYPANKISQKLWIAVESLRDIDYLLEEAAAVSKEKRTARALKIMASHLYSFYQAIRDIKLYYESEKGFKGQEGRKRIAKAWEKYSPEVDSNTLKTIRDQLASHIDQKMSVQNAENILKGVDSASVGAWLDGRVGRPNFTLSRYLASPPVWPSRLSQLPIDQA